MIASYSMGSRLVWADLGSAAITRELLQAYGKPNPGRTWMIERIVNVEKDPTYQEKDIDLVVHSRHVVDGTSREGHVEIKCDSYPAGDLYGKTNQGNFFLELVSNDTKHPCTPGCFLYSEAELLYYLFATTGTLYVMPMQKVRASFLKRFPITHDRLFSDPASLDTLGVDLKYTTTKIRGRPVYRTWGAAVPIHTVMQWAHEDDWVLQKRRMLPSVMAAASSMGVDHLLRDKMPPSVLQQWQHHARMDTFTKT